MPSAVLGATDVTGYFHPFPTCSVPCQLLPTLLRGGQFRCRRAPLDDSLNALPAPAGGTWLLAALCTAPLRWLFVSFLKSHFRHCRLQDLEDLEKERQVSPKDSKTLGVQLYRLTLFLETGAGGEAMELLVIGCWKCWKKNQTKVLLHFLNSCSSSQ